VELDEQAMLKVLRLGVRGIVLKDMAPPLLVRCIRKVHAGGQWLEHLSTDCVLDRLLRREARGRELARVLTPREIEIVRLVTSSLHTKEIARKLYISEGTVKIHLHNIYEKLHLDGRMALLRYTQDKELV
jgi:DNA-binding NarL/FixJ family response regulator